jgi:uncharacterized damage-inducible protein DinB
MWTSSGTALHGPLESPVVAPVTALVRLLDDLGDVIDRVPDPVFARKPAGKPSGSIGAHVRHCLDHVRALLEGARTGRMSYDDRVRGTDAETDRDAARTRIRALTQAVLDLDPRLIARALRLRVRLDARGTATEVQSTVGRELAFVISHTIHHHATIALLLSEIGTDLPARFGVAPSTPLPANLQPGAASGPARAGSSTSRPSVAPAIAPCAP